MSLTMRFVSLSSVLVVFLLVITCSVAASVKAQNEVAWVYDYPTGMKIAVEKNKPVLIYIHEQWCPKCKNMDQNTWNDKEVVALSSNFINISVLGTEQGRLYNYSKPPLVVLTDPQGKVIEKRNEELSASDVAALQRKVLAQTASVSLSPTPSNTSMLTSTASTIRPSNSAKAASVPGFEATLSVTGVLVAVVLMLRRFR
jgi:thiol:disulfide interchange protein